MQMTNDDSLKPHRQTSVVPLIDVPFALSYNNSGISDD